MRPMHAAVTSSTAEETDMRIKLTLLTAVALAASAGGAAAALPPLPPGRDFVRTIDNPWFPLKPGTVLKYRGESDGIPATDVLRVTHRTKRILGIRATVIDDRVYMNGRLAERTTDWYAQDKAGNVWYLGENTATLRPNGQVDSTRAPGVSASTVPEP